MHSFDSDYLLICQESRLGVRAAILYITVVPDHAPNLLFHFCEASTPIRVADIHEEELPSKLSSVCDMRGMGWTHWMVNFRLDFAALGPISTVL